MPLQLGKGQSDLWKMVGILTGHVFYDDVIKWKHFPRYWPFVRGIEQNRTKNLAMTTTSWNVFVFLGAECIRLSSSGKQQLH